VSGFLGRPLRGAPSARCRALRAAGAGEDGFTLIELLAALVVMTIAFTALAGALVSGLAATSTSAATTAANQLAADRLEGLRTVAWNRLGHYADEAGWGTGFAANGESLVQVAATTPTPRPADVPFLAAQTVTVRGVAYSVTTRVTWEGSSSTTPNTGTTYAKKRIDVSVEWTLRGKNRVVATEALRAPTAAEMKPPATSSTVPISLINPQVSPSQTLAADATLSDSLLLRVDTSVVATEVSAAYTLASGESASVDLASDATGRFWTATLAPGTGPFAPGTATFTFSAAHSSGSTATATSTVQLQAPSVAFALTDGSVTTATSQLLLGGFLAAPIAISVKASTAAATVQATYPLQDGTTSAPIALSYNSVTAAWTGEIPANAGPVTPGNLTVTFSGTSLGGVSAQTTASVTLQAPTLGAIAINKPTIVPAFCTPKASPFNLKRNSVATVEVMNVDATGTAVTMQLAGQAVRSATALGTTGPSGGQLFRVTYTTTTQIPTATIGLTVNVVRSADNATATNTWSFPVTQKNGAGC
jgi:prepilin-type N-terminal cleavage/methylation domain-containing protein